MNTIGIFYQSVIEGVVQRLFSFGSEPKTGRIPDDSGIFDLLSFPKDSSDPVYLLSFDDSGCYIRIIKRQGDAPQDHISCCIVLPAGMDMPSDALKSLLDAATAVLLDGADEDTLKPYIGQSYSDDGPIYPAPRSLKTAIRFFEKDENFLEPLYQTFYSNYKTVVFASRLSSIRVNTDSGIENISGLSLGSPRVLRKVLTTGSGQPDRIFVNNVPFTGRGIYVTGPVNLRFEREGFPPHILNGCTVPDGGVISIHLAWKRSFGKGNFTILDADDNHIRGCSITVNSHALPVVLTEDAAKDAVVSVQAEGFAPFSESFDLWDQQNVVIRLEKTLVKSVFTIQDSIAELSLEAKGKPKSSPLKGYKLVDKERGVLAFDPFCWMRTPRGRMLVTLALAIPLILGAVCGFFLGRGLSSNGAKTPDIVGFSPASDVVSADAPEAALTDTLKLSGNPASEADLQVAGESALVENNASAQKKDYVADAQEFLQGNWCLTPDNGNPLLDRLYIALDHCDADSVRHLRDTLDASSLDEILPILDQVAKGTRYSNAEKKIIRANYIKLLKRK